MQGTQALVWKIKHKRTRCYQPRPGTKAVPRNVHPDHPCLQSHGEISFPASHFARLDKGMRELIDNPGIAAPVTVPFSETSRQYACILSVGR